MTSKSSVYSLTRIKEKIHRRTAKIGQIGLGIAGLFQALELCEAGFSVIGYDKAEDKVKTLNSGKSYVKDITDDMLMKALSSGRFKCTSNFGDFGNPDILLISVLTFTDESGNPDQSAIIDVCNRLYPRMSDEQLVIIRSTVSPGTTEQQVLPILEKSGLTIGKSFFLAYAPERSDPGNRVFFPGGTRIIGGVTRNCTDISSHLYQEMGFNIIGTTPLVAELVKLFENAFRYVNVCLVNELQIICEKVGISARDIVELASTKGVGFLPFYPGAGIGGIYLPTCAYYLKNFAVRKGVEPKILQASILVNKEIPDHIVAKTELVLNEQKKVLADSRILVVGVSYKRNSDDYRLSPSLDIIKRLLQLGAQVDYFDPHCPSISVNDKTIFSRDPRYEQDDWYDCSLILTDHTEINLPRILRKSKACLDTRNGSRNIKLGIKKEDR